MIPEIGSRWRRAATGKLATLLSVRVRENMAYLRCDGSPIIYGVQLCDGRPCGYELVEEVERNG